jgi:hypothetical protein
MRRRLPYNKAGDNLFHRVLCYRKHGRFPSRELLWNDMWYRVKTSGEIEDPLRRFVSDKEYVKQFVREIARRSSPGSRSTTTRWGANGTTCCSSPR